MASQRKNPTPAKRVAPVAKKPVPKKPVLKKPVPKRPAPKRPVPKPAALKKPVKPVARKPAKPVAKKPVAVPKAAPAKPRKLKAVARPPVAGPNVRPLGVLPASARARSPERPAAPAPAPVRPAAPAPPKKGTRPRGPQRLTAEELLELEEKLREERAKLMKEVGHLESTVLKVNPRDSAGDLSGYSFHMADAGTDAYERELGFQFASAEGRLLREFNEALRRLYAGEYGVCESCGNAIARARLLAIPTARLCRDCKEKEERQKPSQS
jgi:RNA polymerase-binding transcription factor DksA